MSGSPVPGRVVLGLGGCVDYELRLSGAALQPLVQRFRITAAEVAAPRSIESERDLVISILGYLALGAGGEHHVSSLDVLTAFAQRFDTRIALGGTSVRAGLMMSRLGVPAVLHLVCFNEHFRQLLPANVDYLSSGYDDAVFPHLILQYERGTTVRAGDVRLCAPVSNRLIYVNDPANENLAISDQLGVLLASASLFLVSGFNAIADEAVLSDRLLTVRDHLHRLPPGALVYYEDAGFHQPGFTRHVHDALLDSVDIYGLNEDEMQAYLGRRVDLGSATDVTDALNALRALIPVPTIVVHTQHWSAAVGADAHRFATALDQGMIAATTRYQHGDGFSDADLANTRDTRRGVGAMAFAVELGQAMSGFVCCRPGFEVYVPKPTTVGLGDTFVGGFLAALQRNRLAA